MMQNATAGKHRNTNATVRRAQRTHNERVASTFQYGGEKRMGADIQALIRQARQSAGSTQEEFAERLGISPRYLQQLESFGATPSLDLALRVASVAGRVELLRERDRYVLQAIRPNQSHYLNAIDRSPAAVLFKLAEELSEGAMAVSRDALRYINHLSHKGEDVEALAAMYEQCIADVHTALEVAEEWFAQHRPDVAERGWKRHQQKVWQRGYVVGGRAA